MNRTALSLFAAAALACAAFGQSETPADRADVMGDFLGRDYPFHVIHSGGNVFIYQLAGSYQVIVHVTTEQAILDAALGGGTAEAHDQPRTVQLQPAYPNPFNPATTIDFSLERAERVRLVIHNLQGQEVAVVLDELLGAGQHSADFDGAGLASGVYTYTLQAGGFSQTKTFSLVK